MGITFGGLASGLPVDDIIKQLISLERRPIELLEGRVGKLRVGDAQFQNAQARVETLQGTLKKLTADSVLDSNLFRTKSGTISDEAIAGVTVGENASPQTISLEVVKLATSTRAQSQSGVGNLLTGASQLSDIAQNNISNGDFTVFVDGVANTITVDNTQDVDSVLTQISSIAGITGASVVGGKLQLDFGSGTNVQLGANGDSSNFLNLSGLQTGVQTATSITGATAISTLNLGATLNTAAANFSTAVTDGTFTVGTATFDITGKSMSDIISEINNSPDAEATAFFNVSENRLELISTETGSALVTLANGTSNFLEATGLVVAGDTTVSQTQGENAEFTLNGSTLFSASNTVTEGISGFDDLTLDLKGVTSGTPVNITIGRDTEALKETLRDFVVQFNQVIQFIDEQTDSESPTASLKGESGLRRFRNQIRTQVSDIASGLSEFNSLGLAGISTGAVTNGLAAASPELIFDEAAFDTALAQNGSEVEDLFVGTEGILTKLQAQVDQSLFDDPGPTGDGLFPGHSNSVKSRIDSLNDQIQRGEDRLEIRERLLRQQFLIMERLISESQSQGNALNGLISQLNAGNA